MLRVALFTVIGMAIVWMLLCAWCGYRAKFLRFFLVMAAGLSVNAAWMVYGLQADPFSQTAMMTHFSGLTFAMSSFGLGWIVGRFVRTWRDSSVNKS